MDLKTPPPEKRARRLHPVFKVMLGVAALVFLLLAALCGLVLKEYRRQIPPPETEELRPAFLTLNGSGTAPNADGESHRQTQIETVGGDKPVAKSTPADATSTSLKYKPVIPDATEIPPELRAKTAEVNQVFDHVFSEVQKYEQTKDTLKPEEALKRLEQTERLWYAAYMKSQNGVNSWRMEAVKALNRRGKLGAQQPKVHQIADAMMNLIQEHSWELTLWSHGAKAEVYARMKQWVTASNFAWARLRLKKWQWQMWRSVRNSGQPVFISDFYQGANERDHDRVAYYYQQQGGLDGFAGIAELYLERKREAILDRWSGGQKRSPEEGKAAENKR